MHPNSWQTGIVASTVLPAAMQDSLQGEQTTVNVHIISTHSTHEDEKGPFLDISTPTVSKQILHPSSCLS
jgi:hypothetical protein